MSDIPIKVEKTRSGADPDEMMSDERHMNGRHSSSSDSLNSRNSSENSSKVHHIPIFIEGRDEPVSRHETVFEEEPSNFSRTSSNASSNGRRSNLSNRSSPRPHPSSPSRGSDSESPVGSLRKGRTIPITVESQLPYRQVRPGATQSSQSETRTTNATKSTPCTGPFVTKVPVRRSSPTSDDQEEGSQTPEPAKVPKKPTPLEEIQEINNELSKLKQQVTSFSGEFQDKQYRFLDEMLTRLLIRLDNVEPNGDIAIRTARKATVNAVEACASLLEAKAKAPKPTNTDVEMKDESPDTTTEATEKVEATEASGGCSDGKPESNEADVAVNEKTDCEMEPCSDPEVSESKNSTSQQPISEMATIQEESTAKEETCDEPMAEQIQQSEPQKVSS